MEETLLNDLIELIRSDHPTLKALKTLAIKKQQYELAAQLREYERIGYPETVLNSFNFKKEIKNDTIQTTEELIETLSGIVEMLKTLGTSTPIILK